MIATSPTRELLEFGPFTVDPVRRLVLRNGDTVQLAPKAFDTLIALLEQRGRVVTKDEIFRLVWPDTIVEEINLNVQISALRKALGEQPNDHRYIVTVPRRGYSFVADVSIVARPVVEEDSVLRSDVPAIDPEPRPSTQLPVKQPVIVRRRSLKIGTAFLGLLGLALLLGASLTSVIPGSSATERTSAKTTIAVLPFHVLSNGTDASLGIGLTDALIMKLGSIQNLAVRSTASVLPYQSQPADPIQVGRALNVRAVLEGSIQVVEGRVRISVHLFDVGDGSTLWSETFDKSATDAFSMQDDLATEIASTLNYRLTGLTEPSTSGRESNPEALMLYLRGRYHWNRRTDSDLRIAMDYYRRALDLDPDSSLAYSGLADCYNLLSLYGGVPPSESFPKAREMAEKAVALDRVSAEAHTSLGFVLMKADRDLDGARIEFEKALALNPKYATAHQWYGWLLLYTGDPDAALGRIQQAAQLDPLSISIQADVAWALYFSRRYDDAAAQCNKAQSLDFSFAQPRICLSLVYIQQGRYDDAIELCSKTNLLGTSVAAVALAHAGESDAARDVLTKYRNAYRHGKQTAFEAARIYLALGDRDEAIRWLKVAAESGDLSLQLLAVEPSFDSLRNDAEFLEVRARCDQANTRAD